MRAIAPCEGGKSAGGGSGGRAEELELAAPVDADVAGPADGNLAAAGKAKSYGTLNCRPQRCFEHLLPQPFSFSADNRLDVQLIRRPWWQWEMHTHELCSSRSERFE